jgi:thiol:disulfide interchange protein
MTHDEAIESLINSCNEYDQVIEQLQEENAFLADTIEKYNLDEIQSERRSLLAEVKKSKTDSDAAIKNANAVKEEYLSKINELNSRLEDVKLKQQDINAYIEIESNKKIESIKADYQKHKAENDKKLEKHIAENNQYTKEQQENLFRKNRKWIIISIISIAFGVLGILINFI